LTERDAAGRQQGEHTGDAEFVAESYSMTSKSRRESWIQSEKKLTSVPQRGLEIRRGSENPLAT
jgi:hypothetical protein